MKYMLRANAVSLWLSSCAVALTTARLDDISLPLHHVAEAREAGTGAHYPQKQPASSRDSLPQGASDGNAHSRGHGVRAGCGDAANARLLLDGNQGRNFPPPLAACDSSLP